MTPLKAFFIPVTLFLLVLVSGKLMWLSRKEICRKTPF